MVETCGVQPLDKVSTIAQFSKLIEFRQKKIALDGLSVEHLLVDIGEGTISRYIKVINKAATIFVNGPTGVYRSR